VPDDGGPRIAFETDFVQSGTAYLDRDVIDGPPHFDADGDPLPGRWAVYAGGADCHGTTVLGSLVTPGWLTPSARTALQFRVCARSASRTCSSGAP
jgi:hypothetical protein